MLCSLCPVGALQILQIDYLTYSVFSSYSNSKYRIPKIFTTCAFTLNNPKIITQIQKYSLKCFSVLSFYRYSPMRFSTSRFFHNFFTYLFIVQQTNGLKYFLFWYSIRRFYSNFSIFHGYDTQASQSPWGKITPRVNLPRYDTPVSQSPDYDTRGESISPGYDTPSESISRDYVTLVFQSPPGMIHPRKSISPGYDTPGESISRGMIHWWVNLPRV